MPVIRGGAAGDLPAVAAIQEASPGASRWNPQDYLQHDLRVALWEGRVAGFLVTRSLAPDEFEILNLVVSPEFRRKGIGRGLVESFLKALNGAVYLEVRESNQAARDLYKSMKFQEVAVRDGYYQSPSEAAIVMKFHSC
jgi:ribosomal-protein-alanine N-acetyltransferase